jgi:hypothetical protein
MRLITHPAGDRNRAERLRGIYHELLCHLDAAKHDIQMHGRAERSLEDPMKMTGRLTRDCSDGRDRNRLR